MSGSAYEIAALAMRFWLAVLMVFLLWRIIRAVLRDYSAHRTEKKADAGYSLGVLEVVGPRMDARGKPHPLYGRRFALRRENRIGRAKSADIRVNHRGIAPHQASIFQKGNRVLLTDFGGRNRVFLNGEQLTDDAPLVDGDEIVIGDVAFVLHLVGSGARPEGRPRAEEMPRPQMPAQPAPEDVAFDWTQYVVPDGGEGTPEYGEEYDVSQPYDEYEEYEPEDEPEEAPKRKRRWRR